MKYIRKYKTTEEYNNDLIVPIVCTKPYTENLEIKGELKIEKEGTINIGTGTSKTNIVNDVTYNFSYSSWDLDVIGIAFDHKIIFEINNDKRIEGYLHFIAVNQLSLQYTFTSNDLYVNYYYKEPSGQGAPKQTINVYTKESLPSTISYKIYAR